jgi:predicted phosphate transport protein (TIGR00153 family)
MGFDALIRWLLPREERFHDLFSEHTRNLVRAAEVFLAIATTDKPDVRQLRLVDLKAIEHAGDQITRRIFEALNSTFLTPLDREDIRSLAVDIDDVLDYLEGIAQFLVLFEPKEGPEALARFAQILLELVQQIDIVTGLVWDRRDAAKIQAGMVRISELENQADGLFLAVLGNLFRRENGYDAIEVLKWKEIYQGLEDACDKCKDFTHVVGNIVIKNA